jgi:hypothetical protein
LELSVYAANGGTESTQLDSSRLYRRFLGIAVRAGTSMQEMHASANEKLYLSETGSVNQRRPQMHAKMHIGCGFKLKTDNSQDAAVPCAT